VAAAHPPAAEPGTTPAALHGPALPLLLPALLAATCGEKGEVGVSGGGIVPALLCVLSALPTPAEAAAVLLVAVAVVAVVEVGMVGAVLPLLGAEAAEAPSADA
jgi:hypothetical protein